MNCWRKEKYKQINLALKQQTTDQSKLRTLCRTQGGLLDNETRSKVWPKLINSNTDTINIHTPPFDATNDFQVITQSNFEQVFKGFSDHKDYTIVKMDVKRSGSRMPKRMTEHDTLKWQGHTIQLIMNVLHHGTHLHYYQGYHDIALTILLCFGYCPIATTFLWFVSQNFLVDYMYKDMSKTSNILKFLNGIVSQANPKIGGFLVKSGVGEIFCLSWLITWFSHSLGDVGLLFRFFDLFIVSHPFMPLYVTAAIVLERSNELVKVECEMAQVHQYLSQIPKETRFETIIQSALILFNSHPPYKLSRVNRIPLTPFLSNKRHTQVFVTRRFIPRRMLKFLKSTQWNVFKTGNNLYFPFTITISIVVVSCVISASLFVLNYYETVEI